MNAINKLTNWYFSRRALLYWCVLLHDCTIVSAPGYIGKYIEVGGDAFAHTFWQTTYGLLCHQPCALRHLLPALQHLFRLIRYFMLIPEVCKLVLEAGSMEKGGEIFVFDMGKPVKIVDLAQRMIQLSGAKDIEIKFTGLRDDEKLYEEVLNDAEGPILTHHPKIMIAKVREYDYETTKRNEDEL